MAIRRKMRQSMSINVRDEKSAYDGMDCTFLKVDDFILEIIFRYNDRYLNEKFNLSNSKTYKQAAEFRKKEYIRTFSDKHTKIIQELSSLCSKKKSVLTEDKSDSYKSSITLLSEPLLTEMACIFMKNKIITKKEELTEFGKYFTLPKIAIQKLKIDLYIIEREEKPWHISTLKWMLSCCCFFSSTSKTTKLDAARTLKTRLDLDSKVDFKFNQREKEALSQGSLGELAREFKAIIK